MTLALGLQVTLRAGEMPAHIPAHVDQLVGANRAAERVDGGPIDRALSKWAGAFRVTSAFPARGALGRVGAQNAGYDDREHLHGLSRTVRIRLRDGSHVRDALAALRDLRAVEFARPETLGRTPAPMALTTPCTPVPGHELVRAHRALPYGDERVIVAIVDSGVAMGHPELQRKLLAGYDTVDLGWGRVGDLELIGNSRGHDFNPRDEVGHGSHVAGVIGAQGFRVPRGIAGRSLILPLRVLAAAMGPHATRPVGIGGLSDIDCGLKVACDLGAKVINMSFGTGERSLDPDAPPPHREVIDYAVSLGVILVAAMGNTGDSERLYPAAHPDVIAVGAVDGELRPCAFSTRGKHCALAAPGDRIYSLDLHGYRCSSGTSHAAPFVSGAAARLVAYARSRGVDLDGRDIRRLLTTSAQARPKDGPDDAIGHGVLDVGAAFALLRDELARDPGKRNAARARRPGEPWGEVRG
ncbi:S8 family peptidase [Pendulispora albinea]|uniref:S8 family serine peptidase n=1 Tax=Pendulispora albinea TaxID=2741071 RepID=A0ABZ2M0Q1_9BACT